MPTPTELHVCAGLNACAGHGKTGANACAGTGDCATVVNNDCHGNNDCRGQGGCGGGGSLGSQQTAPGDNLCRGKGSCFVPASGIDASRVMGSTGERLVPEKGHPNRKIPDSKTAIPGIYEGRHVWQVARLLFEQRMMASGRAFTNDHTKLGPRNASNRPPSSAVSEYLYFGPPPADKALGPGTNSDTLPDWPAFSKTPPT